MDIVSMKKIMTGESLVKKRRLLDALFKVSDPEPFDVAYDALNDKSDFIVTAALQVIDAKSGKFPVSVKKITDVLNNNNDKPYIRSIAVRVLGNADNHVAIKKIIDSMEDKDEMVQIEATEAIIKYKKAAVLPLINAITEEEVPWYKREKCALALSFLSTKSELEVEVTIRNVLTIKGENIQFSVVRAFKEIGNIEFFNNLKTFLKIETLENRVEIQKLLKNVTRKEEMENLIASLAKMDEKKCLEFIVALKSSKKSIEHLTVLERILKSSENKRMKAILIRIMGLSKNDKIIPIIVECLKDPDKRVRANAVETITDIGSGDYIIDLIKPLLNDFDNRVRANAAKGLWKLGGVRSLQILREMIENNDKWMRASAIYALGEIGVMQVVDLLMMGINDPDPDVKINTIKGLIKTGDKVAIHAVMDLSRNKSEEWIVRKNALISLARSGDSEALVYLKELETSENESPLVKETVSIVLQEVEGE